jgi:hypothetical protein
VKPKLPKKLILGDEDDDDITHPKSKDFVEDDEDHAVGALNDFEKLPGIHLVCIPCYKCIFYYLSYRF